MEQAGQIGSAALSAGNISDPMARQSAQALVEAARQRNSAARTTWQSAADTYNNIRLKAYEISAGYYNPPSLSGMGGMGNLGFVQIAAWAALLAAAGYLAMQLSNAIAAAKGDTNATRGYLDQLSTLVKTGGDAAVSTIGAASDAYVKAAVVLGVGAVGYVAFKALQKRGHI
jgi:hypothetical protein